MLLVCIVVIENGKYYQAVSVLGTILGEKVLLDIPCYSISSLIHIHNHLKLQSKPF